MCPFGGVYFAALSRRLVTICSRRVGSASNRIGSSGREIVNACPCASISARLVSMAWATAVAKGTDDFRNSIRPLVMRDTSSRSSSSRAMCLTCRSTISAAF